MTTKGFDDLLEFLLLEIAFRGLQGASLKDFTHLVHAFYQESHQDVSHGSNSTRATTTDRQATDRELLRMVWTWLTSHPDISIGRKGEGNGLSYDEIERRISSIEPPQQETAPEAVNVFEAERSRNSGYQTQSPKSRQALRSISGIQAHENSEQPEGQRNDPSTTHGDNSATTVEQSSTPNNTSGASRNVQPSKQAVVEKTNHTELRIYASQERVWRALAGHDVDWRRIPKMELDLLSIIAASGENGILQSALVQSTGQDKRSVPHRTDRLHANGYISKQKVMANSNHTSVCKHRRFVRNNDDGAIDDAAKAPETRAIFKDGIMFYDQLLQSIFSHLHAHDNIMTLQDLRKCLGIESDLHQSRLFYRMATRLEKLSILKRVKAKAENSAAPERRFRCLKVLREPNAEDFREFASFGRKQDKQNRETNQGLELTSEHQNDLEDLFADHDDTEILRVAPQWTPDIPHANFIFNLIDSGGSQGLVSKDLRFRALGNFWKRSLDTSLGRLSDVWELAQPQHLRHLAIIRDTLQAHKGSQYVYRTHPNFQRAVDEGQTEWEAVITSKTSASSKNETTQKQASAAPTMEDLGFSPISDKQFLSTPGLATLSECENRAKIQKQGLTSTDPCIKISEDGALGVDWGLRGFVKQSRLWKKSDIIDVFPQNPPKSKRGSGSGTGRGGTQGRKLGRPRIPNGPTDQKEARAKAKKAKAEQIKNRGSEEIQPSVEVAMSPSAPKRKSPETDPAGGEPAPKRLQITEPSDDSHPALLTEQESLGDAVDSGVLPAVDPSQLHLKPSRKRKRPSRTATPPGSNQAEQSSVPDPRVRINPPGSERPYKKPRRGRRPKSLIVTIRIDRLRQTDWSEFLRSKINAQGHVLRDDTSDLMQKDLQQNATTDNVEGNNGEHLDTVNEPEKYHIMSTPKPSETSLRPEPSGPTEEIRSPGMPPESPLAPQIDAVQAHSIAAHDLVESRSSALPSSDPPNRWQPQVIAALELNSAHRGSSQAVQASFQETNKPRGSHANPSNDWHCAPRMRNPGEGAVDMEMLDSTPASADLRERAGTVVPSASGTNEQDSTGRPGIEADGRILSNADVGTHHRVPLGDKPANNDSFESSHMERDSGTYSTSHRVSSKGGEEENRGQDKILNQEDDHNPSSEFIANEQSAAAAKAPSTNRSNIPVIQDVRVENSGPVEESSSEIQNHIPATSYRKRGVAVSGGFVAHSRAKTILHIIKQAGGVFPGGNAIWYPFVTAWGDNPDGTQVDRKTLSRVVKSLVEQDRLRKITFIFKGANGAIVTRYVLALPDEDSKSSKVREMQKCISDAHPFQFLPPGVEVSDEVKTDMTRTLRGSPELGVPANYSSQMHSQTSAAPANSSISEIPEPRDIANRDIHGPQQTDMSAEKQQSLSRSLIASTFRSPSGRFQNDDTITVRRIDQPLSPNLERNSKASGTKSNQEGVQRRSTKQDLNLSSTTTHASTSKRALRIRERALDRLHLHQKNTKRVSDPSNPTESGSGGDGQPRHVDDGSHDSIDVLNDTLTFINKGPASFDVDYARTESFSLVDPDQTFHATTGTFSTESSVIRNARLDLWRNLDTQKAFEEDMPYDIRDVVSRGTRLCKPTKAAEEANGTPSSRVDLELLQVRKWEESVILDEDWQYGYGDRRLKTMRFINHRVPNIQDTKNSSRIRLDWDNKESEHFTARDFPLTPALKGRERHSNFGSKSTPSEPRSWYNLSNHPVVQVSAWSDPSSTSVPHLRQDQNTFHAHIQPTPPVQALHGTQGVLVPQRQPTRGLPKSIRRGRLKNVSPKTLVRDQPESVLPKPSLSQRHQSPARSPTVATSHAPSVTLDSVEKRTLIQAVAVVRSLTSGAEQKEIPWGLVARACGYMHDGLTLKKCWISYHGTSKKMTDEFQERFQARFVNAYEKGELPALDYSNLEDFEWARLLDWARKTCAEELDPAAGQEHLRQLPSGGRRVLSPDYSISKNNEDSRLSEKFFSIVASAPYRDAIVNRSAFFSPVETQDTKDFTISELRRKYSPKSDLEIAQSWIRANCLTPDASFDRDSSSRKLLQFTEKTISAALEKLISNRILRPLKKNRHLPGRNYDITDFFLSSFRRPLEVKNFKEAARYKEVLDSSFHACDTNDTDDPLLESPASGVVISPYAEDGEVMAVLNLLASKHVKLVAKLPPISDSFDAPDPKLLTWGFTAPGYQTVQMDRKKLEFDLEIRPTDTYTYGNPLKDQLAAKRVRTPPSQEIVDRSVPIPLWYDINGDCLSETWDMVVVAILATLTSRPGADVDTIVECCKGNLERWEALLCLEWCEAAGALRRIGSGWTTQDWWWLAAADDMSANMNVQVTAGT